MLSGQAEAVAHGAATIVNAIALGKGAAFGVSLWTKAQVKLTDDPGIIRCEITSDKKENPLLTQKTVERVLKHFKVEKQFGAKVTTYSNIPIAKGLKSSSTAANAVALATVAALGKSLSDLEVVQLGVDAAFDANVTVTGAFDDACASFFGGAVITDNTERKIVKQMAMPEDLVVLFHVPSPKAYTANSDVQRLKTVKSLVEIAYSQALKGKVWDALTLNGLIYSAASNLNAKMAIDALAAGAMAAGLCGKGPATTAVVPKEKVDNVKLALQEYEGEILQAKLNCEKAKVTKDWQT
jgi:shikimate kinase